MRSERGSIGDSFTVMITIFLAGIIMIIVPLLNTAEQVEVMDQNNLQAELTKFAEECASARKITEDAYDRLVSEISAVNMYVVEIQVWQLDENVEKKTAQTKGNNSDQYIIMSPSEVLDKITTGSHELDLKPDWKIHVYAYNKGVTGAQQLSGQGNADITTHSSEAVVTVR